MLLNYAVHTNVNGIMDVIEKIRAFAVANGWTQYEYRTGEQYQLHTTPYGWQGTPDAYTGYLCLTSPGYGGSQNLVIKLCSGNYMFSGYGLDAITGYNPNDYRLQMHACTSTAYDQAAYRGIPSMHNRIGGSWAQNPQYGAMCATSMPHNATIHKMWIFGNDKWLCCVLNIDGVYCTAFHAGSFEPFITSPTNQECSVYGRTATCGASSYEQHWTKYVERALANRHLPYFSCFDYSGGYFGIVGGFPNMAFYYEGEDKNLANELSADVWQALETYGINGNPVNRAYNAGTFYNRDCFYHNVSPFTNKRLLTKTTYLHVRNADGVHQPIARSPFYVLNNTGLEVGQVLDYAAEQYMVFPLHTKEAKAGVAFRIA